MGIIHGDMEFRYIIRAEGSKALAVRSSMQLHEMQEYIRLQSTKTHPEGNDTVFHWGCAAFVNPVVMLVDDFANWCPALI